MGKKLLFLVSIIGIGLFNSCRFKNQKSTIEVAFVQDTLNVGYTYWWPEKAPFGSVCNIYNSLIFVGTITQMGAPNNEAGPLYTSQTGVIEIEQLFKLKSLEENPYKNQKFIKTSCFYESGLAVNDTVLVFCADYEDNFSIPGNECIIKISGFDDPLITSIRRYIDKGDAVLTLEKDIGLWATHNLGRKLEATINCHKEMNNHSNNTQLNE